MKKIVSLLLVAVMLIGIMGVLSGCNQGGSKIAADFVMPEGGFDTTKPVTIVFYHQMGAALTAILNTAIEDFNKIYPNITVEHYNYSDYNGVRDQIKTEISVGDQPNMAYCYPDHVALYNVAGAVQTLDTLIKDEKYGFTAEQIADFIPAYYNEGKAFGDGKMYTLPISKSTEVLYYNKTFFEKNGLTVPTTWEEMEAVCRQIKAIDPTCIPLGYDSEANWFITMCEQYQSPYTSATGDHFLFNNEQNRAFIKTFRDWYQKGYLTTQTLYGSYTSGLFVSTTDVKSYMSIGSSAGATHQRPAAVNGEYPFEVGIATVPQADANNKKVISQGPSLCIFQKANPQEVIASWLFVKFLTTTVEFQAEFALASGYVPVLKSVSQHPVYAGELEKANGGDFITSLAAKVCLEQADFYYTSPAFVGSSVARTQVGNLIANCLTMTGSDVKQQIAQAFQDAIDECEYQAG